MLFALGHPRILRRGGCVVSRWFHQRLRQFLYENSAFKAVSGNQTLIAIKQLLFLFKTEQALQRVNEALDAGVSGELLTPLPLEHVKLGAAKVNSAVKPNWTATDVTDVQYFDVERSLSGSVFRCIYSTRRIPYSDKM